ncbi:MAG: phasin family protein [Burkholderiales bacterium]|nr:phasin family protein [Burkholderiales bacterium]
MVKKLKAMAESKEEGGHLADAIRESAEKIWLAGLGSFAKARKEPAKAFEVLVREGLKLQTRTRAMAEERIGEVAGRVSEVKSELGHRAGESWDRLEQVFEDRVARTLEGLGVPTGKEVQALIDRVDQLTAAVQALGGELPRAAVPRRSTRAAGATRAPRKASTASTASTGVARKSAPRRAAARKGNGQDETAPAARVQPARKSRTRAASATPAPALDSPIEVGAVVTKPARGRKPRARKPAATQG